MLRYSFWKGTGVIKRTNLLVTHASLLLCDSADSHEMCWIKAASDSVTQELCKAEYSRGFDLIKWVYRFILKDHCGGFVAWFHTSESRPGDSKLIDSREQQIFVLRMGFVIFLCQSQKNGDRKMATSMNEIDAEAQVVVSRLTVNTNS